jgi:hypothetical protein
VTIGLIPAAEQELRQRGDFDTPLEPRGRRPGRRPSPDATSRRRLIAGGLLALALIALAVPARRIWAAELASLVLLLTAPGLFLLRALRVPGRAVAAFPVYIPFASLVVVVASALAVDLAGPGLGVARPLRPLPVLVACPGRLWDCGCAGSGRSCCRWPRPSGPCDSRT